MRARTPQQRRRLRRQFGAVLAVGMTLGLGSAVTLAAWTDTEVAQGSFTASVFRTESASQGSPSFADHSSTPVALTFGADAMSPGVSRYAWLRIRTTAATNVDGEVWLSAITPKDPLSSELVYRAIVVNAGQCSASAFTGSPTFIAGDASTYLASSALPGSAVKITLAKGGAPERELCFDVKIKNQSDSSHQGELGSITWTFTAESTE